MRTGSAAVSRITNKKKSAGENRRKSDTATFFSYTVSMRKEKREQLTRQLTKSLELPGESDAWGIHSYRDRTKGSGH